MDRQTLQTNKQTSRTDCFYSSQSRGRQTYIWHRDRETESLMGRQMLQQIDRLTDRLRGRLTLQQSNRQRRVNWQIDRQTQWHVDRHRCIEGHYNRQTEQQTDRQVTQCMSGVFSLIHKRPLWFFFPPASQELKLFAVCKPRPNNVTGVLIGWKPAVTLVPLQILLKTPDVSDKSAALYSTCSVSVHQFIYHSKICVKHHILHTSATFNRRCWDLNSAESPQGAERDLSGFINRRSRAVHLSQIMPLRKDVRQGVRLVLSGVLYLYSSLFFPAGIIRETKRSNVYIHIWEL